MPDVTTGGRLLARNTLLNVGGQAVSLLVGLAAMPFIVRGLGHDRFGLLGLGWVVLGYFGVLDFGMGRAATRFAADALARGARAELPAITWSAVLVQSGIGLAGALLLAAGTPYLARDILQVEPALVPDSYATFRVLAVAIPIVLVSASFRGVLEAAQRFDLVQAVSAPGGVLNYLVPLAGALAGWGLSPILWLLVGARGLSLLGYLTLSAVQFPEIRRSVAPRRDTIASLLRFGAWATVSNVVSPILDQLDRFLLGAFAGVTTVGFYTAPQEIVLRMRILPTALAAALFPRFSGLGDANGPGPADRQYGLAIRFLCLALTPVCLALVLLGPDLLRVWLGDRFAQESGTALKLLAIGVLLNAVAYVPFAFLQGVNRPDIPARFHLLELPFFLGLAWLLMPRWGVTGAAAAWTARASLDACLLLWAAPRWGASHGPPALSRGFAAWLAVVAAAFATGLLPAVVAWNTTARAGWAALLGLLVLALGWFGILGREDRDRIRSLASG